MSRASIESLLETISSIWSKMESFGYESLSPYNYIVYFDIIAYDTLTTIIINDKNFIECLKNGKITGSSR